MNISTFIKDLTHQGIHLHEKAGELKVSAEKGKLKPDIIELLRTHKKEIIDFLLELPLYARFQAIDSIESDATYEVSHSQKRMWILNTIDPSSSYIISNALSFKGLLDKEKLEASIGYLINRHEVLRTIFVEDGEGSPRQYIQEAGDINFNLDCKDLSGVEDKRSEINILWKEEQEKNFDLTKGPLLRSTLLQLSPEEYVLFFTLHHIISDGWSMEVLIQEVVSIYEHLLSGKAIALAPLRIQYKDYAFWQNRHLEEASIGTSRSYWQEVFSGDLPLLNLVSDKARPVQKTYAGSRVSRILPKSLKDSLERFCMTEGSTLFMGLLSSVNALLHRYTGQEDIILGSPVAGRELSELENQLGLYLNTVGLRTRFSGSDNFKEMLRKSREVLLEAYSHQSYPFDMLLDDLQLKRDLSRSALFDVMIIFQNQRKHSLERYGMEGLEVSQLKLDKGTSHFDLTFEFVETEDGLLLNLNYNKDLYGEEWVIDLGYHYEQLLSGMLSSCEESIGRIAYLGEEDKDKLLKGFNATQADYPEEKTFIELFEEQVLVTPDSMALVYQGVSLSYQELNVRANQLGHYLRNRYEIKSDDLIGLVVERTEWMLIGLLGIMKSGAGYVSIDPELPRERNQYIVSDSGVKLLLTQGDLDLIYEGVTTIDLRDLDLSKESNEDLKPIGSVSSLAYVIYTSGTTNVPKGVMVEQGNLTNYSYWACKQLELNPSSVSLLTSSIAFDLGYTSVFPVLISGGALHIIPKTLNVSPDLLVDYIQQHKVTFLKMTPSLFSVLVESKYFTGSNLPSLQTVVLGGEMIHSKELRLAKEKCSHLQFVNHYGPTETTIGTIAIVIEEDKLELFLDRPVIGKPIWNSSIYILDKKGELLPLGAVGEICVGGAGVSRGYLGKEALTEEKFIRNVYGSGRLYRTGDLGRWLANGTVEILGRVDDQIKIRGYRVELSEIEHRLQRYEKVRDAVVLCGKDKNEHPCLIGYVVSESLDLESLRIYLGEFLPSYMIPDYFVEIGEIPLTSNGKVDRKALLSMEGTGMLSLGSYAAASNPREERLVEIWETLLGRTPIGVTDNFFSIGGNSIKSIKLTNAINTIFKANLSVADVFKYSTIRTLALQLSVENNTSPIQHAKQKEFYDLTNAQLRIWVQSQLVPYNMCYALTVSGKLDVEALGNALSLVVERHESLRMSIIMVDGYPKQRFVSPSEFKLDYNCIDYSNIEDQEQRIAEFQSHEIHHAFDLENDSLFRITVLKCAEDKYIYFNTMHHIIGDGWSTEIFVRDLVLYYSSLHTNKKPGLKQLEFQFKDYAEWEKSKFDSDEYRLAKQYWINRFKKGIPRLILPQDRPRTENSTFKGKIFNFAIPEALSREVNNYSSERQKSLFVAMLAVFKILLFKYSSSQEVSVGTIIAGREHENWQNQIGMYAKTLILKTELLKENTFSNVVDNLWENHIEALKFSNYPIDQLAEDLKLSRNNSYSMFFDVMVILHNHESDLLTAASRDVGLVFEPIERQETISKFDLTFNIFDTPEITFKVEYNSLLFDDITISVLMDRYIALLEEVLTKPDELALADLEVKTNLEKTLESSGLDIDFNF